MRIRLQVLSVQMELAFVAVVDIVVVVVVVVIVKHESIPTLTIYSPIQSCAIQSAQWNLFLESNYYWVGSRIYCSIVFVLFLLCFGVASAAVAIVSHFCSIYMRVCVCALYFAH